MYWFWVFGGGGVVHSPWATGGNRFVVVLVGGGGGSGPSAAQGLHRAHSHDCEVRRVATTGGGGGALRPVRCAGRMERVGMSGIHCPLLVPSP